MNALHQNRGRCDNCVTSMVHAGRDVARRTVLILVMVVGANLHAQSPSLPVSRQQPAGAVLNEPRRPATIGSRAEDTGTPRTAFNALPRGTQKFDGVTFHVRGPVNVIGTRAA